MGCVFRESSNAYVSSEMVRHKNDDILLMPKVKRFGGSGIVGCFYLYYFYISLFALLCTLLIYQ